MNSKTHFTKIIIIWLSTFFTSFTSAQNTVDELVNPNLVAFQEDEVTLPKAPIGKNLLQFFPSSNASLNFFVDSQSLSFVKDLIPYNAFILNGFPIETYDGLPNRMESVCPTFILVV
jgi:hypothetical protein